MILSCSSAGLYEHFAIRSMPVGGTHEWIPEFCGLDLQGKIEKHTGDKLNGSLDQARSLQ
jgi:hypothetical protein